ncbi:MAG: universal stress protein [Cyanobacteria bacterium P01_A01_bin.40]
MKNILAAIDFSDVSSAVVDKAAELANSFGSKLWLIHVAAPDPDFVGYDTGPQCERDWRAKVLRKEHRYLQDKALELEEKGIKVTPLLVQGATVETILQETSKLKAEMVVIGSHGRGALYKTLVGSVSEGVIRRSLCPVLVIPAKTKGKD